MDNIYDTELIRVAFRKLARISCWIVAATSMMFAMILWAKQYELWLFAFTCSIAAAALDYTLRLERPFALFLTGLLTMFAIALTEVGVLSYFIGSSLGFTYPLLNILFLIAASGRINARFKSFLTITVGVSIIVFANFADIHRDLLPVSTDFVHKVRIFNLSVLIFTLALLAKHHFNIVAKQQALLERTASLDPLTELYNRRKIIEASAQLQQQGQYSVLICDLDHFKAINDNYGHNVGDEVLKHFSQLLKSHVRELDFVGRWGGEEFVLILPNTSQQDTVQLANRIRTALADSVLHCGTQQLQATVTIGAASLRADDTFSDLIKRADDALYKGKESGRNTVAHSDLLTSYSY